MLRVLLSTGKLNLQANTPALMVSDKDQNGWITVTTPRGTVRTKTVVHATVSSRPSPLFFFFQRNSEADVKHQNAWASHLLPEYTKIILPSVSTVGAIKAPEGFIKNTGAQHWGGSIWNYHLQLPPPYNTIALGGAKAIISHYPREWLQLGDDDKHLPGVPEYMASWPTDEVVGWPYEKAELEIPAEEGGVWTGLVSPTADAFPFVGPAPAREGHFIAAGFGGHGMPRILLATAHITPMILDCLGVEWTAPALVKHYPPLPKPFVVTAKRVEMLQDYDMTAEYDAEVAANEEAAKMDLCGVAGRLPWNAQA